MTIFLALVLTAVGCVAEKEEVPEDSVVPGIPAGVSPVTHSDLFGTVLPVRVVDTVAAVRVGEDDVVPLYNVVGALLLSDGTLVIADRSQQLHFVSSDGSLLRSIGGEGEGPGEFEAIRWIDRVAEDSILVHDGWLRRITVFARSGELGRVTRVPPVKGTNRRAAGTGAFTDGTLALWQEDLRPIRAAGSYRNLGQVLLFRDGEITQVTESPGDEIFAAEPLPGQSMWRMGSALISQETLMAVRGRRLYLVDTGSPVIDVYEFDKLVMQIRDLKGLAPIPEDIWSQLRELGMPLEIVGHSTVPFLASVLAAGSGDLWLLPFQTSEGGSQVYTILRPDGTLRDRLAIPDRYKVLWAEDNQVVVLSETVLGVEVISVFRIGRA